MGAGVQTVTAGTNAPAAGDIEIRFSSASLAAGLTDREVKEAMDTIFRFLTDPVRNGSVWPNL